MGCEVLGIDDYWKQVMNVFLEVLDIGGQRTDESFVEEAEVGEEVVADDNMNLVLEFFDNPSELLFDGR